SAGALLAEFTLAYPCFRQIEFHAQRRHAIPRDHRRYRSGLFITGREKKSRRATVALTPNDVEIRVRMPQLDRTVRAYASAAVDIWIYQRPQRFSALQRRIDTEAQLAINRKIRALTGGSNDRVQAPHNVSLAVLHAGNLNFSVHFPQ